MSKVKIVSLTQPLVEGINTAEDLIVYCARVSNPNNQLNLDTAPKLIKYCIDHGHWSIFEQADMAVEVITSRSIAAQILRHKSANFQEYSQRYSNVQSIEEIELRKQADKNRQSSDTVFDPMLPRCEKEYKASEIIQDHLEQTMALYEELIHFGVARECARQIMPLASTTTMYMKNNVRNWIHYINLRTKEDTQLEHRKIAEEIKAVFIEQFPNISEALGYTK